MLTNAAVARARSKDRAYKLADGRGLHLYVAPTGLMSFRWRFRFGGKEQLLTIGSYPEVTLDQARARRDVAAEQLRRGEDPRAAPAIAAAPATFEPAARAWHAHRADGWTRIHAADVLASLERDVFPAIGAVALGAIDAPAVLKLLRAIEARGAVETASRVQERIRCVFAFAKSEGWTDANPADGVEEAMARAPAARHLPSLRDPAECRALLAAAELVDVAPAVKLCSRLLALTAVRFAAAREARWGEIEDLDGPAPLWRVPAARMKLAASKKLDAANDHLVPLSPAAAAVLRAARANAHRGDADPAADAFVFPGRGGRAPIGERAISDLYVRAGYAGRHVPHGWRASFSTILNEARPEDRSVIDQALGHVGGGRAAAELGINRAVEGAYNRADYLPARRRLLDAWGEILTTASPGGDVGDISEPV